MKDVQTFSFEMTNVPNFLPIHSSINNFRPILDWEILTNLRKISESVPITFHPFATIRYTKRDKAVKYVLK